MERRLRKEFLAKIKAENVLECGKCEHMQYS